MVLAVVVIVVVLVALVVLVVARCVVFRRLGIYAGIVNCCGWSSSHELCAWRSPGCLTELISNGSEARSQALCLSCSFNCLNI